MDDLKFDTVEYSTQQLKDAFPKGSTVYLVIRQVSRSGMYRHISCHSVKDSNINHYSYHVGVGGCGMDMGFHMVYTLASVLYGDGYALKERYI